MLREIRIHGRGGQGSVVLAQLLAVAAFRDGKFCQAFPYLGGGGERRGAPVQAFVRLSDRPLRLRTKVHQPDYVIVQDPTLYEVVDLLEGIKPEGLILVNSERRPEELGWPRQGRIYTVPAARIAREILGSPFANTALLGAFAALTGEVSLKAIKDVVRANFAGETGERNALAVECAYEFIRELP